MPQLAIQVKNLSKQYRIGAVQARYQTLRESLVSLLKPQTKRAVETIWALQDVSLEVTPGEVVGVIGRNGAGKSTLLKILSRITEPTRGSVDLWGRVGSLLEVGTGFHPELTGRENVFLNGAILGMRRDEIERKFDEIVAFAEVEQFVDTPTKHYSSGMYMRLAFSVAAHLESEILLVDEVLAVGDVEFQRKCLGKMGDVARAGRTVLFVSHNMSAIRNLCNRAVLLNRGQIASIGDTDEVIAEYLRSGAAAMDAMIELPPSSSDYGRGLALRLSTVSHQPQAQFRLDEPWLLTLEFEMFRPARHVIAAVGINTLDPISVITYWSRPKDLQPGCYRVTFRCDVPFKANNLQFSIGLSENERAFYYLPAIGHAVITEISTREQPFRASGAGLLLSWQESEIEPAI